VENDDTLGTQTETREQREEKKKKKKGEKRKKGKTKKGKKRLPQRRSGGDAEVAD